MKSLQRLVIGSLLLCAALLFDTRLIVGESNAPEFTAEVSGFSQHVWRGMALTDGPVMQPSGALS